MGCLQESEAAVDAVNLCRPWEHHLSRRQWLGSVAAVGVGALGLGGLAQPVFDLLA